MNKSFLISVLAGTATAVLHDLIGYERARGEWKSGKRDIPPTFDWKLFATRVAIGLISGALAGAGINAANPQ